MLSCDTADSIVEPSTLSPPPISIQDRIAYERIAAIRAVERPFGHRKMPAAYPLATYPQSGHAEE